MVLECVRTMVGLTSSTFVFRLPAICPAGLEGRRRTSSLVVASMPNISLRRKIWLLRTSVEQNHPAHLSPSPCLCATACASFMP